MCKNDYLPAGYTAFSKVRVDLTSMQIKSKCWVSLENKRPPLAKEKSSHGLVYMTGYNEEPRIIQNGFLYNY